MKQNRGHQLIKDLKSNPSAFFKMGKSHDLLQEYFDGLSLETLIPLLQSSDLAIQRPTIWIVSELAGKSCSLLPHILPLVDSADDYIRYYALECILLCANGRYIKEFVHLIRSIDDDAAPIKVLAMKLLVNAEDIQLRTGAELVVESQIENYQLHQLGLSSLLDHEQLEEHDILAMLNSKEPLTQQYGAMVAGRRYENSPKLILDALASNNVCVQEFAQAIVDMD
jgi:hypothetical protein